MFDDYYRERFPNVFLFRAKFAELLETHDTYFANQKKAWRWKTHGFLGNTVIEKGQPKDVACVSSRELRYIVAQKIPQKGTMKAIEPIATMIDAKLSQEVWDAWSDAVDEYPDYSRVAVIDVPSRIDELYKIGRRLLLQWAADERNPRVDEMTRHEKITTAFMNSFAILDSAGWWNELVEYSEKVLNWEVARGSFDNLYICFYARLRVHVLRRQWQQVETLLDNLCVYHNLSGRAELLGLYYAGQAYYWLQRYGLETERLFQGLHWLTLAEGLLRDCPTLHAFALNTRGNLCRALCQFDDAWKDYVATQTRYGEAGLLSVGREYQHIIPINKGILLGKKGQSDDAQQLVRGNFPGLTEQSDIEVVCRKYPALFLRNDPEFALLWYVQADMIAKELGIVSSMSEEQEEVMMTLGLTYPAPATSPVMEQ